MATSIAELNRQITIRHYITFKDPQGYAQTALDTAQSTWAKVEQISNNYTLQQMQVEFGQAWLFTLRYEPSRQIFPTDDILYDGSRFTINGVTAKDEGKKRFTVIRASNDNKNGAVSITPVMTNFQTEIHTTGKVVIGGPDYTNWTGKILAYRDSLQYPVKREGSATGKEINYDMSTGLFSFPPELPDLTSTEQVNIYFFV